MAEFVAFDPLIHEGRQLWEVVTVEQDDPDVHATGYREADVEFAAAALTPWYYFVIDEDDG
jgi:hypothetical protein